MLLIFFSQTVFGILFVIRILRIFRGRALISTRVVTKTGTILVSLVLFSAFLCANHVLLALFVTCACVFLCFATLLVCERRQIDALKREIPIFLDRWILNLRLGSALPSARESALREQSEAFQALTRPILAAQARDFANRAPLLFAKSIAHELERIQIEPHSALQRLENLRHMIRKQSDFRRKSGQATRQTHTQAVLMLFMLIALIIFTLQRYGWGRIGDLVMFALILSATGLICMQALARKTKWKI